MKLSMVKMLKRTMYLNSRSDEMDYSKRLDDVMDEYLQVFAKDPNDILTDDMTDYDKIKKLEQAIQSGASDE